MTTAGRIALIPICLLVAGGIVLTVAQAAYWFGRVLWDVAARMIG